MTLKNLVAAAGILLTDFDGPGHLESDGHSGIFIDARTDVTDGEQEFLADLGIDWDEDAESWHALV